MNIQRLWSFLKTKFKTLLNITLAQETPKSVITIDETQYLDIYQRYWEDMAKKIEELNAFWNTLLKLAISCSMGILFGSIAFVSLPFFKLNYFLMIGWWATSWLFLLGAIICFIIASLQEAKFFALNIKKTLQQIKRIIKADLEQRKSINFEIVDLVTFAPLRSAALGFVFFLWGTIGLVGSVLSVMFFAHKLYILWLVILLDTGVLAWIGYTLYDFLRQDSEA